MTSVILFGWFACNDLVLCLLQDLKGQKGDKGAMGKPGPPGAPVGHLESWHACDI